MEENRTRSWFLFFILLILLFFLFLRPALLTYQASSVWRNVKRQKEDLRAKAKVFRKKLPQSLSLKQSPFSPAPTIWLFGLADPNHVAAAKRGHL